jgi:hypothetical protein
MIAIVAISIKAMESFKRQVLGLQTVIDALESRIRTIEGLKSTVACHYVSTDEEFGIVKLDDLDTFRFHTEKIPERYGVPVGTPDPFNGYKYKNYLKNPTEEIKELSDEFTCPNGWKGFFQESKILCILSKNNLAEEQNLSDCVIFRGDYPSYGQPYMIPISNRLKKAFETKFFEVSENRAFERKILIEFDHEYKIPPHVSFYVTPIDKHIDSVELIDITNKKCVIQIKFGGQSSDWHMTADYTLHFHVRGVLRKDVESGGRIGGQ